MGDVEEHSICRHSIDSSRSFSRTLHLSRLHFVVMLLARAGCLGTAGRWWTHSPSSSTSLHPATSRKSLSPPILKNLSHLTPSSVSFSRWSGLDDLPTCASSTNFIVFSRDAWQTQRHHRWHLRQLDLHAEPSTNEELRPMADIQGDANGTPSMTWHAHSSLSLANR